MNQSLKIQLAAVVLLVSNFSLAAEQAVVKATGTVEPRTVVDVSAPMAGIIKRLGGDSDDGSKSIDYGSHVKKGAVLAELDTTTYEPAVSKAKAELRAAQSEIDMAKAQLALAKSELERAQKRAADKVADAADVDVARAGVAVAQAKVQIQEARFEARRADLDIAQSNLDRCILRSPIDGVLIDRRYNVGQWVTPDSKSPSPFLIADLSNFQIWASVNESDIAKVAVGQPVQFTVDALPKKTFTGKVRRIRLNASMTNNTVLYTVEVDVDDGQPGLMPYMTADVDFLAGGQTH